MKVYELTHIISPTISLEEAGLLEKNIESLIQNNEGVILRSERISIKTLSYPIKKQSSGYFASVVFQIEEEKIKIIKEKIGQEKNILRHIIVVKKPIKEMKTRRTKYLLNPPKNISGFFELSQKKKTEKIEVKEEDINKKLDEILSE